MRKYVKYILGSLLLGAVAFAVAEPRTDKITSLFPQWFQKGFYVGTTLNNPVQAQTNKITGIHGGSMAWDFISLSGSPISLLKTCDTSNELTVTGATLGDTCTLGVFGVANADGGALPPREASLHCNVTQNNKVAVTACARGFSDGGVVDLPDAGYRFIVFSNQ